MKKDIIYPIFLQCCQYSNDMYWKNIFEDLTYGKSPYGTYIHKNFLCCSYKNKQFSYKITKKDPETLYNDIYNLLSKKMGILSYKEKVKKREDFHKKEDMIKNSRNDWSNIKKKNIKDLLIERYVVDMKEKYSLTLKQAKYLLSFINVSIVFKTITSSNIHYSKSKITDIDGIEFSHKNIIINSDIFSIENGNDPHEKIEKKKVLSDNWEKYLNVMRKCK